AGDRNTVTVHTESNCKYMFDVTKIMFAKGNLSERVRVPQQVKKGEIIVDMFAGIGYFSIPLGKLSPAEKIYAIELNPVSFYFLQKNIALNKLKNVEAVCGDNRTIIEELIARGVKADRVMMGYLPPPKAFLPSAFTIIKKGGMIHYEDLVNSATKDEDIKRVMRDIEHVAAEKGFSVKLVLAKCIKSYGPKIDHYVFDVKVE
ncbi:MAG: tRNA wyosine derivative biosynthesis protein Taw2, partial [archaeon]